MPTKAFVIRFPNGDFEYDLTRRALPYICETLRRKGLVWAVLRITPDRVDAVHAELLGARRPNDHSSASPRRSACLRFAELRHVLRAKHESQRDGLV